MLRTHLTVLETSASLYPTRPAFKTPRSDCQTGQVQDWQSITYQQFKQDVELFARHWSRVLRRDRVPQKSVVGVWYVNLQHVHRFRDLPSQRYRITGFTYLDILHIYGVSRAGYIPQLFSIRLPNPDVVFELLRKSDAKALIHESTYASVLGASPVPTHLVIDYESLDVAEEPLPQLPEVESPSEIAFLFHTSGSTSGSPKVVPWTYRWLDTTVQKSYQVSTPRNPHRQDVTVWM